MPAINLYHLFYLLTLYFIDIQITKIYADYDDKNTWSKIKCHFFDQILFFKPY